MAPAWVVIFGTVSAMITAVGLFIAGAFAYFKFIKGRTFRPRCFIDIEPQLVKVGETRALRVSATVRNESQIALLILSDVQQQLLVSQADHAIWEQACKCQQPIRWEDSGIPLIEWNLGVPERDALDQPKELQDSLWWRRLSRGWLLRHLDGDKLEPGEQWARSSLVPVEPGSVAYLVCVQINACRHVAVRHVIWHRRRCCNPDSPYFTWEREIYVFPEGER